MKIVFIKPLRGTILGEICVGTWIELDRDWAQELIDNGYAEPYYG